jgi:type VI secretion system protein ImpH
MVEPDRLPSAGVDLEALETSPEKFSLFAALRLIEAAYPQRPRLGEARRARDEPVRLGQPPHLHFPPAAIASFEAEGTTATGMPRLLTYAFGLFGPQGPLPLHISREAFSRSRHASDSTFADFCDLFHHRLLALYYRAYAAARPAIQQDRPAHARFRDRVSAVAGMPGPAFRDRTDLPDTFSLFTAGLLTLQARPPEAITRLIGLFFAVPVRIREFVGAWLEIPANAQTRLGLPRGNALLGRNTTVGSRVYLRHQRFRILLGPLTLDQFLGFLPDHDASTELKALVRQVAGLELDWDAQLVLRRDEVPVAQLGSLTRLGRTSWIHARRRDRDADDVILLGNS